MCQTLLGNFTLTDRILGSLVLGSFMFARGRGLAHWNEMLAKPRDHIQKWHPLPDCN